MEKKQIIRMFSSILPESAILHDRISLRAYECDALSAYRQMPMVVLLPSQRSQIQDILRLCYQHDIAVVCRGAGTGLSGGALPLENGVLLSLAKFNRIHKIDADNRSAVVEPGVTNIAVSQAARAFGLYYAPDPSSQIACTIGGNIAENAGGIHCLKYGLTYHNILQIKIITIQGELLNIGSGCLEHQGYDFMSLFTGSEGLLGVIAEAKLRLLPLPAHAQVVMAAFADASQAAQAVADIIGAGIIPAGLEMMDKLAIEAAETYVHAGYPRDAQAILLCELDGTKEEVHHDIDTVNGLVKKAGAFTSIISQTEQQRQQLWQGRKAAFPAVGRLSPDYYCMDGTIPRKNLPKVLQRIGEMSRQYGLRVANVFHAGDGNLHPLILYDANLPGQLSQAEAFGAAIVQLCIQAGGTITGEHGVGVEKINQMCRQFDAGSLNQFLRVKKAWDEKNLLNPGKAIPTLKRCAEFGAMHVHHGELPFPELERF